MSCGTFSLSPQSVTQWEGKHMGQLLITDYLIGISLDIILYVH